MYSLPKLNTLPRSMCKTRLPGATAFPGSRYVVLGRVRWAVALGTCIEPKTRSADVDRLSWSMNKAAGTQQVVLWRARGQKSRKHQCFRGATAIGGRRNVVLGHVWWQKGPWSGGLDYVFHQYHGLNKSLAGRRYVVSGHAEVAREGRLRLQGGGGQE
ncbi:hypothetical protein B0H34DRAFT_676585 [Crassisporium funariophilum]|nr:hypothetical protein B0H34DRAFT_676585 [Crassisporium funariophilum]